MPKLFILQDHLLRILLFLFLGKFRICWILRQLVLNNVVFLKALLKLHRTEASIPSPPDVQIRKCIPFWHVMVAVCLSDWGNRHPSTIFPHSCVRFVQSRCLSVVNIFLALPNRCPPHISIFSLLPLLNVVEVGGWLLLLRLPLLRQSRMAAGRKFC